MRKEDILCHVDHTLLTPTATWEEIRQICDEAIAYHTASVCIPPSYVKQASDLYSDWISQWLHDYQREGAGDCRRFGKWSR